MFIRFISARLYLSSIRFRILFCHDMLKKKKENIRFLLGPIGIQFCLGILGESEKKKEHLFLYCLLSSFYYMQNLYNYFMFFVRNNKFINVGAKRSLLTKKIPLVKKGKGLLNNVKKKQTLGILTTLCRGLSMPVIMSRHDADKRVWRGDARSQAFLTFCF